uniref:Interleukin 6 signal transducer n=1 Tax=Molossus molossus TaxID=27622 RepID=A0A7J8IZQ4_MOLMO|nr:interleukin 6 signal transducer [Molossus molossus]
MSTLRTWVVQTLLLLLTTESQGSLLDLCGSIEPEAPVVQLGSSFTAVCVLKERLKPLPPSNLSVSNSEELSSILKLTWINSSINKLIRLKYSIQYRAAGASTWSQIPLEDTASTRSSFTVQDLRPFTEYAFRVRCMKEDGKGFWSAWSEEARGSTAEDRLRSTSGLTFQTRRRVTSPSGPHTRLPGITLIRKTTCTRTATSLT